MGVGPGISGTGENGIQSDLTGDPVVSVPDITTVGIGGDHRLRSVGAD